jgi:hypothetical protein
MGKIRHTSTAMKVPRLCPLILPGLSQSPDVTVRTSTNLNEMLLIYIGSRHAELKMSDLYLVNARL